MGHCHKKCKERRKGEDIKLTEISVRKTLKRKNKDNLERGQERQTTLERGYGERVLGR